MTSSPAGSTSPASPRSAASRPKQQIHPFVSYDVYRRFRVYCARRGVSQAAVVETAIRQYLDQSSDPALIMRRLDRSGRRLERIRREVELLSEFVSVWVRLWLAHTPQLPEAARTAAQSSAAKRYQQILEFVSKRLSGGQRLATDLIGDEIGDEDELASAAGGTQSGSEPPP